ncbi:MAG: sodium:solute symporter family protein [Acidaminococcus sp.]|jgi:Na+/proline symporter|nr:sodium:solute symporter family protein [Acidaminococcus sp.]MCI2100852.1 sodium:solute symporter family protein [Acidaminococcus sp.]MCI2115215.1 sodium:solute symporter family protein [Acidaminococcus sp.]MCI2116652.1 sodium:solute symporter family protein [Acidaminococcus sp.]
MFTGLDYIVIALYVVALAAVGWYAASKVKNASDFLTANHGLGLIVMIGSLAGAAIGAVGTIGLASDVYTIGVSGYWQIIGWNAGWLLLAIMAKRVWETGASSIADIFGKACGRTTRLVASLACLGFSVPALASQLVGLGNMFNTVFTTVGINLDYKVAVIILSIVMIIAVFRGGLYSSAYSGTFNFFILGIVFVICLPLFTCKAAGGVEQAFNNISVLPPKALSLFTGISASAIIGMFVKFAFVASTNIAYVGNTLAAKDAKTARNGSYGGIISYFVIPGIIVFSILALRSVFPGVENTDGILTYVFVQIFPSGIRGLSIVALIAVVLSTAVIWVQNSGKITGSDIYTYFKPDASDHEVLMVSRVFTIIWSIAAIIMAMYVPKIMVMYSYTSTLYGSSMFFPLVFLLYWKGVTKYGLMAGMVVGMVSSILDMFLHFGGTIDPVIVGSCLNGITVVIVSLLTRGSGTVGETSAVESK